MIESITYQGGKQRIAQQIIDIIEPTSMFYDLCCGSGAISINLVNRGYPPGRIYMLDKGPWGLFWKMVGEGSFDIDKFKFYIDAIPDISLIQSHVKELSKQPAENNVYIYLILQASSFGGKAIWVEDNKWRNCSFRSYWQPTATSNRRSHVNPMMPMPGTLFNRVKLICERMKGVKGHYGDIYEIYPSDGIIYIDPPYQNTTFYGSNFDVMDYVSKVKIKCYVSEAKPLSEKSHLISSGRKKGGISGVRESKPNEEWLSVFN